MSDDLTILLNFLNDESLCLDSSTVGLRIDASSSNPKAVASRARREGKIFAGWNGHHYRYPAFQFKPAGGPWPKTSQLIEVLPREKGGAVGNDAVLWVFWPDHAFDKKTPAELFLCSQTMSLKWLAFDSSLREVSFFPVADWL